MLASGHLENLAEDKDIRILLVSQFGCGLNSDWVFRVDCLFDFGSLFMQQILGQSYCCWSAAAFFVIIDHFPYSSI